MEKSKDKLLQYIISGQYPTDDELDRIIRDDPSFDRAEFEKLKEIWEKADTLRVYQSPDREAAWGKIARETLEHGESKGKVFVRWLVAAGILLALGLGLNYYFQVTTITHLASTLETYRLPDESTVLLRPGSSITHKKEGRFRRDSLREIYLEGIGTFDIMPEARPFIANSELTRVEVLGTRFFFRAEGRLSEVENLEGRVRFSTTDGTKTLVLETGEKSVYNGIEMTFSPATVDTVSTSPLSEDNPSPSVTAPDPKISREKPANNLTMADLVRILKSRYPKELEWPAVRGGKFVIRLSLSQDLDGLMQDMLRNEHITIEAIKTDKGYNITKLEARNSGLEADYTYDQFKNGISPK